MFAIYCMQNFYHFVFCATLLDRISDLLAYEAALLVASFWGIQASVAEWLMRESQVC